VAQIPHYDNPDWFCCQFGRDIIITFGVRSKIFTDSRRGVCAAHSDRDCCANPCVRCTAQATETQTLIRIFGESPLALSQFHELMIVQTVLQS